MTIANEFPQTIYRTSENWGNNFFYMNEDDMRACISDLHKLGDEWESCSFDECAEFRFDSQDGELATYIYVGARKWNHYVFNKQPDGTFGFVRQY